MSEGQAGVACATGWRWATKNKGSANATRQKNRLLISSLMAGPITHVFIRLKT
jgi:hypothetical protein